MSGRASNNSRSYQSIYERRASKRLEARSGTATIADMGETSRASKVAQGYLSQTRASQLRNRRFLNSKLTPHQAKSQASLYHDHHYEGLNSDIKDGRDELHNLEDLQKEDSVFSEIISVTIPAHDDTANHNLLQSHSFDNNMRKREQPNISQQSIGEHLLPGPQKINS